MTDRIALLLAATAAVLLPVHALAEPVEWPAASGGNGHWYEYLHASSPIDWHQARDSAVARGGYLATLTSAEENSWVQDNIFLPHFVGDGSEGGPYIGASCEGFAYGDWHWVTGEAWGFSAWSVNEPSSGGNEQWVGFTGPPWTTIGWNNTLEDGNRAIRSYIVEYDSQPCRPLISQDPEGVEVTPCQTAVFTVAASSQEQPTYRWRRNSADLSNNARISGATTPTLTIRPAGYFLGGTYDVVVTSSCGSVTSQTAQLTLRDPADFNGDGDTGTDSDIAAFFACLGGSCCATCLDVDINGDGDLGTDADIESFFRVLAGGPC